MTKGGAVCKIRPGAAQEAGGWPHSREEVVSMVTYSDLIQIGILIVGILDLILQITKRK